MGLFGGFRAKFSKDTVAKKAKSSKKEEVVCVGYRVYSEFDELPKYQQTSKHVPLESVKKPTTIKTVLSGTTSSDISPTQQSTSTPKETQIITNPKAKKSTKTIKAPEVVKQPPSTAKSNQINEIQSIQNPPINGNRAIVVTNEDLTTQTATVTNTGTKYSAVSSSATYLTGATSSFNPNPKHQHHDNVNSITTDNYSERQKDANPPKSILKPSVYFVGEETENANWHKNKITDYSDTLTITNNNTENEYPEQHYEFDYETNVRDFQKGTQPVAQNNPGYNYTYNQAKTNTNEDVRHMRTKKSREYSYNDTGNNVNYSTKVVDIENNEVAAKDTKEANTLSYEAKYNYSQTSQTIGSTSSHAASIFFAGDGELQIQRPRRANLDFNTTEEDEKRNSVEC